MKKKTLILTLTAIGIVLMLLYWFNPVETPLAPRCVFKAITGWSCCGCGIQRCIHAFMHGRFLEAIHYNYIIVILIPYLILFGIEQLVLGEEKRRQWKRWIENRAITYTLCALMPTWFIVRNILHI